METDKEIDMAAAERDAKLYAIIGRRDFRIEELQDENRALQSKVAELLKQSRQDGSIHNVLHLTTDVAVPSNDFSSCEAPEAIDLHTLDRAYSDLQQKYSSLETLHKRCDSKIRALEAKCNDYKSKALLWKRYTDKQMKDGRIPRRQATTSEARPSASVKAVPHAEKSSSERILDRDSEVPYTNPSGSDPGYALAATADTTPGLSAMSPPSEEHIRPQNPLPHITSSQTTVEDTQLPISRVNEIANSSEDEPELVFERCLKRKASKRAIKGSPARRIKLEMPSSDGILELSSDPAAFEEASRNDLMTLQPMCSDLDRLLDPDSVQALSRRRYRANSSELVRASPQLYRTESSRSEGDYSSHNQEMRSKWASKEQSKPAMNFTNTDKANLAQTSVLRQISGNVLRSKQKLSSLERKPAARNVKFKVGILSEDGDDSSQVNAPSNGSELPTALEDATLDGLLMGQPREHAPDVVQRMRGSVEQTKKRRTLEPQTPLSTPKVNYRMRKNANDAIPRGIEDPPTPPRPDDEPLRLRDVKTLKRDDFKINPKYLGTDLAFADTLRGRDERRNLHVCAKPDCCGGAMQKVVAMGGQKLTGKNDAQVLSEYLGPQYKQIMGGYGSTKQKETVLQAYAHVFAKQHGKHRQAFERSSTPPGFWRTDFATTQENREDRQKAYKQERLEVEARYREAMRPGGQYMFRDE